MIATTTFTVEGFRVKKYVGVVRGIIVRSPTISQGFFGLLKSVVGGSVSSYTEMCEQARYQAFQMMLKHAEEEGADAVLGFRYDTGTVGNHQAGATEVLCYGTAVVLERIS